MVKFPYRAILGRKVSKGLFGFHLLPIGPATSTRITDQEQSYGDFSPTFFRATSKMLAFTLSSSKIISLALVSRWDYFDISQPNRKSCYLY